MLKARFRPSPFLVIFFCFVNFI